MPASSTITVVARRQPPLRVGAVGSGPFVEQLGDRVGAPCRSRVRGHGPPSPSGRHRTPAGRWRVEVGRRRRRASWSCRRRPGPTITTSRSSPATAAAASACSTSSPPRSTVVDGAGSSSLGVDRPREDVLPPGRAPVAGDVCGDRFDPHRPAIRPAPRVPSPRAGSRSTHSPSTRSTARSSIAAHRSPRHPGCGRTPVARRRAGRPCDATPTDAADSSSITSTRPSPPARRCRAPAGRRSTAVSDSAVTPTLGGLGQPPCPQIRDTVAGLVSPGVGGGFAFQRGALEPGRVTTLTWRELGDLAAEGARRPRRRVSRTAPTTRSGHRRSRPDR